ncbi:MAG: iron ABC transporter permease [Candidatus Sericytochromatia bacterium]|nr:iron ABC transporter permease [Candidatus Sericytochromatia bacterium]
MSFAITFLGTTVAWLIVALLAVSWGAVSIPPEELVQLIGWGAPGTALVRPEITAVFWDIRLPRVLLASLAGAGLSLAGGAWQAVLRNPLADPYLIGASAGAAVGAGAALLFGLGGGSPMALPGLAFLGALGAVGAVYRLAWRPGQSLSVERLLLAGVAVSSFLSAGLTGTMVLRSADFTPLYLWLIGSLAGRGWEQLSLMAPYGLIATLGLMLYLPRLNLMQWGDETARSLGVEARRDPRAVIALAALLTASVVSVCGMIGFVGLVVPHLARLLVGPDLRRMIPLAVVLGATLLTAADLAARTLFAPLEVPVGVVTALLGAPFFLLLLARRSA